MRIVGDRWHLSGEIKKVIQLVFRKGFYGADEELLVDVALAVSYPVNLTY